VFCFLRSLRITHNFQLVLPCLIISPMSTPAQAGVRLAGSTHVGVEQELEVRPDLGAGERHPGSPQTAGPDSMSISSQVIGPWVVYPHIATPTLDLTDDQDLEIVDVGSGPDSEVDLSCQTPLTNDIKPDFGLHPSHTGVVCIHRRHPID